MQKSSVAKDLVSENLFTTEEICRALKLSERKDTKSLPTNLISRKELWTHAYKILTELTFLENPAEYELIALTHIFSEGFKSGDATLYESLNPQKLSGNTISLKDAKIFSRTALMTGSVDLILGLLSISRSVCEATLQTIVQSHDPSALRLLVNVCFQSTDSSVLSSVLDAIVRLGTTHNRFSIVNEFENIIASPNISSSLRQVLIELIVDRCAMAWDKQIMYRQQVERFLLGIYHTSSGNLRLHVSSIIREIDPLLIPAEPITFFGRIKTLLGNA